MLKANLKPLTWANQNQEFPPLNHTLKLTIDSASNVPLNVVSRSNATQNPWGSSKKVKEVKDSLSKETKVFSHCSNPIKIKDLDKVFSFCEELKEIAYDIYKCDIKNVIPLLIKLQEKLRIRFFDNNDPGYEQNIKFLNEKLAILKSNSEKITNNKKSNSSSTNNKNVSIYVFKHIFLVHQLALDNIDNIDHKKTNYVKLTLENMNNVIVFLQNKDIWFDSSMYNGIIQVYKSEVFFSDIELSYFLLNKLIEFSNNFFCIKVSNKKFITQKVITKIFSIFNNILTKTKNYEIEKVIKTIKSLFMQSSDFRDDCIKQNFFRAYNSSIKLLSDEKKLLSEYQDLKNLLGKEENYQAIDVNKKNNIQSSILKTFGSLLTATTGSILKEVFGTFEIYFEKIKFDLDEKNYHFIMSKIFKASLSELNINIDEKTFFELFYVTANEMLSKYQNEISYQIAYYSLIMMKHLCKENDHLRLINTKLDELQLVLSSQNNLNSLQSINAKLFLKLDKLPDVEHVYNDVKIFQRECPALSNKYHMNLIVKHFFEIYLFLFHMEISNYNVIFNFTNSDLIKNFKHSTNVEAQKRFFLALISCVEHFQYKAFFKKHFKFIFNKSLGSYFIDLHKISILDFSSYADNSQIKNRGIDLSFIWGILLTLLFKQEYFGSANIKGIKLYVSHGKSGNNKLKKAIINFAEIFNLKHQDDDLDESRTILEISDLEEIRKKIS